MREKLQRIGFYSILIALFSVLLLILYLDFVGIPEVFHQNIRTAVRKHGINVEFRSVKVGFFNGIRISDLVVFDGMEKDAPVMMRARNMRLRTEAGSWIPIRISPRSLQASEAVVKIPLQSEQNTNHDPDREVSNVQLEIDTLQLIFNDDQLLIPQINGRFLGIAFSGEATISNPPKPTSREDALSWDRIPFIKEGKTQARLQTIKQFSQDHQFEYLPKAKLNGALTVDAGQPDTVAFKGDFNLGGLLYNGVTWHKLEGSIEFADDVWQGQRLLMATGSDSIKGELRYEPRADALTARLNGRGRPALIYQLLDRSMPEILAGASFVLPPLFEINYRGPTENPLKGRFEASISSRNVFCRNMHFDELQASLIYDNETLQFPELLAVFSSGIGREKGRITGRLDYDLNDSLVSGQIHGSISPAMTVNVISDATPLKKRLNDLSFSSQPADFSLELNNSPLPPAEWRGSGTVTLNNFRFREIEIKQLAADIGFSQGKLETKRPISLILAASEEQFSLELLIDFTEERISGRGQGALDFTRLYNELRLPPVCQLELLHFHGPPPDFDLVLESSPLWNPVNWQVHGNLAGEMVEYDGLPISHVQGTVRMRDGRAHFKEIVGDSPYFDEFKLDYLDTALTRPDVSLAGRLTGDPAAVKAFVARGTPRRNYSRVWQDFSWDEEYPRIKLKHLHYQQEPDGETSWKVNMESVIEGEKVTYRGVPVDWFSARVVLDLPKHIRIAEIEIKNDGDKKEYLSGNLEFNLGHDPNWRFFCQGQLDPLRIFTAVGDDTDKTFANLEFPKNTKVEMKGTVQMYGGSKARITSNFSGPEFKIFNLSVKDYDLHWELSDQNLRWRVKDGKLYGGKAEGSGLFNTFTGNGTANLALSGVPVSELYNTLRPEQTTVDLGRLTSSTTVDFQHWDEDSTVVLAGDGFIRIEDAKFWEVPLLKNLGDVVGLTSLGRISKLTADLNFLGDQVRVSSIRTDGTVFSMEGQGIYQWEEQNLDFVIRGRTLRDTAFLSTVLRPLSWLFEARLQGTLEEAKWSTVPLGGIMPGNQDR